MALFCIIGTAAGAGAQTGEIAGIVVDATGEVLPGATVALTGDPATPMIARTDAKGSFTFSGLSPGVYAVTVFLNGFREATVDGVAVDGEPVTLPPVTLRLKAFEEAAVVTATRIEEPLQAVPMSISAVTGADIERRAIENLTELARSTPGLTVVDQGARGSNVIIVRGLHTDALNGSEAAGNNYNNGVATYLGDIPLAVDLRLRDIERVEVLLGPQGTLYGAGTLAGAVRYLPRRPDPRRRELEVRVDLFGLAHGGAPGSDAGLTFNLPLVAGRLALRGSVDRFASPGFIDYDYLLRTPGVSEPEPDPTDPAAAAANLRSEPDANTEDTVSARLSLLWDATPDLSALLAYHLQDQRVGARQVNHARSFDTGRYVSAHRYLEPNDRRNELLSLELNWALGGAELTTAAGYSRFSQQGRRDQTDLLIQAFGIGGLLPGTYPGLARAQALDPGITAAELTSGFRSFSAYAREDGREERLSWETRLVSTGEGPWRWVGGAFFNRYDSRGASFEYAPGLTEFSGITPILSGRPVAEPVESRAGTAGQRRRRRAGGDRVRGRVPVRTFGDWQDPAPVARDALVKARTAALNRQKQLRHRLLRRQNTNRLSQINRHLAAIDAEIQKCLAEDTVLTRRTEILTSIPGVSRVTAAGLLTQMPELGSLDTKAVASLAGLAPVTRESGTWAGRSFIQGGRARARRLLYMPALAAICYNPELGAKYRQLVAQGKPRKIAVVAVMRKLLVLANALLGEDRCWQQERPGRDGAAAPSTGMPFVQA